jgi:serine protease
VSSSATELVFRAPARIAGLYDVHVFARDDRTSVLEQALTYTDAPIGPGDGTGGDGTDGSGGSDGDPGDDSEDGGSDDGEPVVRTGPNGERLVRTTKFDALDWSFWALDCSTSCSGVVL